MAIFGRKFTKTVVDTTQLSVAIFCEKFVEFLLKKLTSILRVYMALLNSYIVLFFKSACEVDFLKEN